jgi:hypothetical protein
MCDGKKLEARSWKFEVGSSKLEARSWKFEVGSSKLEGKSLKVVFLGESYKRINDSKIQQING